MKILFVSLLFSSLPFVATAQMKMVVEQSDGNKETIVLTNVRKLTFADSNLNVFSAASTTQSFGLSKVKAIKFANSTATIEDVGNSVNGKFSLCYANGEISATGISKPSNATLYTAGGVSVVRIPVWDGSPFNVSALQQGVYILKVDNAFLKFVKK